MVVQHNLTAMNSNRMLGLTTATQAKSTEKLSSGYKINRAADDAAGLSISEKMRKQIRGLTQASLNAEDGISAVQTAEGALNEVQDMLQRMNELAVKAANGTMSETDRTYIQNEVDQLVTEIDRVAETTKFNETYLLKGDRTADKKYNFEYNETTAYTFEVGSTEDALKVTSTAAYKADGTKVTDADLTGKDSLDDLAGTTYYSDIQGKDESKSTGTTGTGSSYTGGLVQTTDGSNFTYIGATKLYKANGSEITEAELADYFSATESSVGGGYDTFVLKADQTIYTAIEGKTEIAENALGTYFEVEAAETYALVDGEGNPVTDVSEFVEVVEGALKYKDADNKLSVNGGEIAEANLDDYITFEEGETSTVSYYDADGNKIAANALVNYIDATEEDGETTLALKEGVELYDENGVLYTDETLDAEQLAEDLSFTKDIEGALTLSLHVGADATDNNQISIDIDAMSAYGLGVAENDGSFIKVDGKDDSNALAAIDTIKEAIQKVSTQRSALGAVQNRLEHTIANLDNVVENTTSAESQIRDTDMASEMVKYSNNNILAQAGQAMLAQANQSNQGVLSLLG